MKNKNYLYHSMKQDYLIENEGMIIPNVRHRVYKKIINNIDSLENISYKLDSNYAFGMSFSRSLEFCKELLIIKK